MVSVEKKQGETRKIPVEEIKRLRARKEKVFIYGTGMYGRDICKTLKLHNIQVDGFIVSKKRDLETLFDLPIFEAGEILPADIGIVMGVKTSSAVDVKTLLESYHFDMNDVVYEYDFSPISDEEVFRFLDISTKIGCTINCRFCPQSSVLSSYFARTGKRNDMMSVDTFAQCIKKLPPEYVIYFSGYAEPFLNPHCIDMMKIACQAGREICLRTTLVGVTDEIVDQICEIPIKLFKLHVADRRGYAQIPLTEEYYKNVEKIINAKRADGTPLVDECNAQSEPDSRVMEICRGKLEIVTTMCDRAGQLEDDELYKHLPPAGPISCGYLGQTLSHTLLPDGTVVLCCVDFGMKHVLGNLLEQSYEEIENGAEMRRVRKGMLEDDTMDILCRKCSTACPARK